MLSHSVKPVSSSRHLYGRAASLPFFGACSSPPSPGEGGPQPPVWVLPLPTLGTPGGVFLRFKAQEAWAGAPSGPAPVPCRTSACPPGYGCCLPAAPRVAHRGLQAGDAMQLHALTTIEKESNFLLWTIAERSFKVSSASVGWVGRNTV